MITIAKVHEGVWFVSGPASNWVILARNNSVALIDAGYPNDSSLVMESIRKVGLSPNRLETVFVTHAHVDHIGGIPDLLAANPSMTVLSAPLEVPAVRGPHREQITVATAGIRNLLRPRFALWALRAIRAGGTRPLAIPSATAFTKDDLARWGLSAIPLPGHTAGSTGYRIVGTALYATGDAYVTDHAIYRQPREGAIDPIFSHDPAEAASSAKNIPATATVLPGHGPIRVGQTKHKPQ